MDTLYIEGRSPIKGEITISGNKNAVLPMIAACLLTEEKVILRNAPNILDVRVMLEVVEDLGIDVNFDNNVIEIEAKKFTKSTIDEDWCSKIRTSILFAAPLTVRCGEAVISPPGRRCNRTPSAGRTFLWFAQTWCKHQE